MAPHLRALLDAHLRALLDAHLTDTLSRIRLTDLLNRRDWTANSEPQHMGGTHTEAGRTIYEPVMDDCEYFDKAIAG